MNESKNIPLTLAEREHIYALILKQATKIGEKYYAYIPTSMMFADDLYQREGVISEEKISKLFREFDLRKMDALKVSARENLKSFAILNGVHRWKVARIKDIQYLQCEILYGLSLEEEAKLFAEQSDCVENLSPAQKHKANLILNVKECVDLEDVCREFDVSMKSDAAKKGRQPVGTIQSYTDAIHISRRYGKQGLRDIFTILSCAHYFEEPSGLSSYVLGGLERCYQKFEGDSYAKNRVISVLKNQSPRVLKANAAAKYPMRDYRNAVAMYIEHSINKENVSFFNATEGKNIKVSEGVN